MLRIGVSGLSAAWGKDSPDEHIWRGVKGYEGGDMNYEQVKGHIRLAFDRELDRACEHMPTPERAGHAGSADELYREHESALAPVETALREMQEQLDSCRDDLREMLHDAVRNATEAGYEPSEVFPEVVLAAHLPLQLKPLERRSIDSDGDCSEP